MGLPCDDDSSQLELYSVSENLPLNAPDEHVGVASRIAAASLARRGIGYQSEVRRLLDAAFTVIGRNGTSARSKVADIVAEAGLSNDAFYRHFASKEALVAALIEDGALRLASYVAHQLEKEPGPEAKVRRWVEGLLSQTAGPTASTTMAVLWNGGEVGPGATPVRRLTTEPLADLLHEPLAALGSVDPRLHASLIASAVSGAVSQHLWAGTRPDQGEIDRITEFCLAAALGRAATRRMETN